MTASPRNWVINWLRNAPSDLRTPVSIARWVARAVISVTKLNDAEATIKTAIASKAARSVLSPLGDIAEDPPTADPAGGGDRCRSPTEVRCNPTLNPGG